MVLFDGAIDLCPFVDDLSRREHAAEVQSFGFPVVDCFGGFKKIDPANHFIDRADAEICHDLAQFLGHHKEVVHHVIGATGELFAKLRILCGDTDRAGV